VIKEIIVHLLEDDPVLPGQDDDFEDQDDFKEVWAEPTEWDMDVGDIHYLYDPQGNPVKKSRNLRGIREYISNRLVSNIQIRAIPGTDRGGMLQGGIKVEFADGHYWMGRFASISTLKWTLRNWRNVYGAPLYVDGTLVGKVSYRNPALQEAENDLPVPPEAEDFEDEDFKDVAHEEIKPDDFQFLQHQSRFGNYPTGHWTGYISYKKIKAGEGYLYLGSLWQHNNYNNPADPLNGKWSISGVPTRTWQPKTGAARYKQGRAPKMRTNYGYGIVHMEKPDTTKIFNSWFEAAKYLLSLVRMNKRLKYAQEDLEDDEEDFEAEQAKDMYGPRATTSGFTSGVNLQGVLNIYFRGNLAGREQLKTAAAAKAHARYLIPQLEKLHQVKPYVPGAYKDVWDWYNEYVAKEADAVQENLGNEDEDEDEDWKDVALPPEHEEYELWQIKAAEPNFFSRKSMKFHGTRKVYKYRGNYVVLHNVKRMGGHGFGVGDWTLDEYVIYQFTKTADTPEGTLLYKGRSKELPDAKAMIKSEDFRSRREKLGLPDV
jgi:hypothetical protein